jgi:hypothetical protein
MTKPQEGKAGQPSFATRSKRLLAAAARFDTKDAKAVYDKLIGFNIPLFVAGAVYLSGFLVWSGYLAHSTFSPPPVAHHQYILAGLGYIFSCTLLFIAATFLVKICGRNPIRGWWLVGFPMLVATMLIGAFFGNAQKLSGTDIDSARAAQAGFIFIFIFAVPMIFAVFWSAMMIVSCIILFELYYVDPKLSIDNLFLNAPREMFIAISLSAILVNLAMYPGLVHPVIPQALGGAQPFCARLEIDNAKLSLEAIEVLKEIVPGDRAGQNKRVLRTRVLDVYYIDNDRIIVAPLDYGRTYDVLELQREMVTAVAWCDEDRAKRAFTALWFALKEIVGR